MKTGFLREIGNMGRRGRRLGTFDLRRFSKEKTQAGKGSPVSGSSVDLFGGQPRARGTGVVYLRGRETGFLTRPGEGASRAIRIGLPWVSLGASGDVKGKIQAPIIRVSGSVKGSIHASRLLELLGEAKVEGDLITPPGGLSMESGGSFEGQFVTNAALASKDNESVSE